MINKLEWDSEFFGYPVGEVGFEYSHKQLLEEWRYNLSNFKLVYKYSESKIQDQTNKDFSYYLVDTRMPFRKKVSFKKLHKSIVEYDGDIPNEQLVDLAQLAGIHSRFRRDDNISNDQFKNFYRIWIEKSVQGVLADKVFVYMVDRNIVGFATVKINGENGVAPLFAVNRAFEGKGVSFALMNAVEGFIYSQDSRYLVSSTQGINKKAIKVYERFGCKFEKESYVYHLWNHKLVPMDNSFF